jgi:hypothetical protein
MGFEFYEGVNTDTMDGIVYHFNVFLLCVTGIFDNLAVLATRYHDRNVPGVDLARRKNMIKLSLAKSTGEDFLKSVKTPNSALYDLIKDNREFIEMFYPLRHNVAHGVGVKPTGLVYQSTDLDWTLNAIVIGKEIADKIKLYDKPSNDIMSEWGIVEIAGEHFLEPFHFAQTATRRLVEFCNTFFSLLDFEKRLVSHPDVQTKMSDGQKSKVTVDFNDTLRRFEINRLGF